jgi:hypothetical protein
MRDYFWQKRDAILDKLDPQGAGKRQAYEHGLKAYDDHEDAELKDLSERERAELDAVRARYAQQRQAVKDRYSQLRKSLP